MDKKSRIDVDRLSRAIRFVRGRKTLRDVADEIGISASTLSRVERCQVPDLESFLLICDWLHMPPADLIQSPWDESWQSRSGAEAIPLLRQAIRLLERSP